MFQGITTITFDLDDTLWAIWPVIKRAEESSYNYLRERFSKITDMHSPDSLRESRAQVVADMPHIAHDFTELRKISFERLLATAGYPVRHADELLEHFISERHKVTFYPDAIPALERLSKTYKLVSLSNGNADVDRLNISEFFVDAVSARHAGVAKPHKGIFELACEKAGAQTEETLHVGDNPTEDVLGAQQCGMRTVWVNRADAVWEHAHRPDASVTDLSELVELLS